MALPNIKDQVRINPPFASVVIGRTPMIRWHDTYSGARRSALGYQNTRSGDPEKGEERWDSYAKREVATATVLPNGDVEYVEKWPVGTKIEWRRGR